MSVEFARERVDTKIIQELVPLIAGHYVEIAKFQELECEPDFDRYKQLDALGLLRFFTARASSKLIGYAAFFVAPDLKSKSAVNATCDLIYVDSKMRKGLDGTKFIKYCNRKLEQEGVNVIYYHVTDRRDFGRLMERMGFDNVSTLYGKVLKPVEAKLWAKQQSPSSR